MSCTYWLLQPFKCNIYWSSFLAVLCSTQDFHIAGKHSTSEPYIPHSHSPPTPQTESPLAQRPQRGYVAENDPELLIVFLLPKCWDYGYVPPSIACKRIYSLAPVLGLNQARATSLSYSLNLWLPLNLKKKSSLLALCVFLCQCVCGGGAVMMAEASDYLELEFQVIVSCLI